MRGKVIVPFLLGRFTMNVIYSLFLFVFVLINAFLHVSIFE